MLQSVLVKFFGSKHERDVKKYRPLIDQINALEPHYKSLTDAQIRLKTDEFKQRLEKGETLDDLLVEAYALVREAAVRVLGQRHFDVQIIGGIVLHQGKIAEMKTGEGKTLMATMPAYLNAIAGKGVHIVTPNYYLARRDKEWMGPVYNLLGLSVGLVLNELDLDERMQGYRAHITYGVNDTFGFDYLRDNLVRHKGLRVQRELNFAIIDEIDFILVDEARTPLIISDKPQKLADLYTKIDRIIPRLVKERDFKIDERDSSKGNIALTEEGIEKVEQLLKVDNLYDLNNINLIHHVEQALVAHHLYKRDVDYLVRSGEVLIVDEFTGRVQPGRRWSDGLHQAIEAKEKVKIKEENLSTATITYQNYFRLYNKLAGMTGTAETEAAEFHEIYKLDVVAIPPNKPMIREDNPDMIYRTEKEKYEAVIQEIKQMNEKGRPVLVGTRSVGVSERLSSLLNRERIRHEVLNAKNHTKEAELIAHAGETGAVVIATNMAGRGVDIALSSEVREKGGLHIIGTERHESRRIDNQLRGRSGRQGDAGSSRFFLSLEDELMLKFGSEKLSNTMEWLGMKEGVPVEHPWVTKAIENAQKRVEAHNFEARKHILKYDDVRNVQRKTIYEYRNMIMKGENIKEEIMDMLEEIIDYKVDNIDNISQKEEPESKDLQDWIKQMFGINIAKRSQKPKNLPSKRAAETEEIYDEELDADMSRLDEPDTLSIDEIRDRMLKIFESGNKDNKNRDQIMDIKNRSKNQIMDILKRVIHDKIDNSVLDIGEEALKIKRILRNLLDIYDENEANEVLNEIGNSGGNKDPLKVKQLLLTLFNSQDKNAIVDVLEDTISNKIDISPNDSEEGTTKIKDLSEWMRQKFQIDMFQWEQKPENLSKEEIKNRLLNSLDLQEKSGIMDVLRERINTKSDSASKELFKNILEIRDFSNWAKQVLRVDISQWKPRPEVLSNNEIKDKLCSALFNLYDKDGLIDILKSIVIDKFDNSFQKKTGKMQGLIDWLNQKFQVDISQWEPKPESLSRDELKGKLLSTLVEMYERKERRFGSVEMRKAERTMLLDRIDFHWIEHLYSMDYMQEGIGLQAYAQKDPLVEFKKEGHDMFSDMFQRIKEEAIEYLFKFDLVNISPVYQETSRQVRRSPQRKNTQALPAMDSEDENIERYNKGFDGKVGRNDPCPCGSGKKYKKCCGLER